MAGNCRRSHILHIVSLLFLVFWSLNPWNICTRDMTSHKEFTTSLVFSLFLKKSPFTKLLLATIRFYDPSAFAIKLIKWISKRKGSQYDCVSACGFRWRKELLRNVKGGWGWQNIRQSFFALACSSVFDGLQDSRLLSATPLGTTKAELRSREIQLALPYHFFSPRAVHRSIRISLSPACRSSVAETRLVT